MLPPELVIQIIEQAAPVHDYSSTRTGALYTLSLVNSVWRALATPLLYASPIITSPMSVHLLLRSLENPELSKHVRALAVHVAAGEQTLPLGELLGRCGALERLSASRLGMGTTFDFGWLRRLPSLRCLALSVVKCTIPDAFQHQTLAELSLRAVDFYSDDSRITHFTFPFLSHLAIRYLYRLGRDSFESPSWAAVEQVVPFLSTITVYVGDSRTVAGLMHQRSVSPDLVVLWDVDADDLHLLQTSPDAGGWGIENIRYYETGTLGSDASEFTAALEHDATALRSLRTLYLPRGWISGPGESTRFARATQAEKERLAAVCAAKEIRMIDGGECHWDLESMISSNFVSMSGNKDGN